MTSMSSKHIVDCRAIAAQIRETWNTSVLGTGVKPELLIYGDDSPGSVMYRKMILKDADQIGVKVTVRNSADLPGYDIFDISRPVLVQMPLPDEVRTFRGYVENGIEPCCDMDGIAAFNAGRFYQGNNGLRVGSCTSEAVLRVLADTFSSGSSIAGRKAVVIGRSNTVGKPIALGLLNCNATVTICHTCTPLPDLIDYCRQADIVVNAGMEEPLVPPETFSEDSMLIDISEAYDPETVNMDYFVGAGNNVGSITRAILMKRVLNFYAERSRIAITIDNIDRDHSEPIV